MPLIFAAILISVVVVFILEPLFTRSDQEEKVLLPDVTPQVHLEQQRHIIYDNMKDLEFEYQAGKLSGEDYQRTRGDYLAEAGDLMAKEMELPGKQSSEATVLPGIPVVGKSPRQQREGGGQVCSQCGFVNPPNMKFCGECGTPISGSPS